MTRHKQMLIEIDVDPKDCGKCGEDCTFRGHSLIHSNAHCHLFDKACNHNRVPECLREFGKEEE